MLIIILILYILDYILGRYIPTKSIFYEIQNKKYSRILSVILISVLCCSLFSNLSYFWLFYFSLRIFDKLLYLSKNKKPFVLAAICIFGVVCWLFSGYEPVATLTFNGTHEYFTISDCTLTTKGEMEMFDGGKLTIIEPSKFENLSSCTMTFYTITNGTPDLAGRTSLHLESEAELYNLKDQKLGSSYSINGAKMSHRITFLNSTLWFELKITDINGVENIYKIPLTLMK